jgi:hypothetical protein
MDAARARSTLVVPVPEAESVVGDLRRRLDGNAALGVPAHVTVLFPFVPAAGIGDEVLRTVGEVVASVPPFGYAFPHTDWFDDAVLWLAPADPRPFRELTSRVVAAFPQHSPFEGAFGDVVVPHLTIGHGRPRPLLAAAEREVAPRLPVTGTATEVLLLAQTEPGGQWEQRAAFPLVGSEPVSPR